MMNFDGSHDSVSTLAHELGHAFHNVTLGRAHAVATAPADGARRDRVDLLRDAAVRARGRAGRPTTPSGSRCSTRTSSARRRSSSTSTAGSSSRASCAGAAGAPASSVADLNDGDARRAGGRLRRRTRIPSYRHQYMWAVKPHYFTPFYNWPYTFGLLFGIGLYARYVDDPERFRAGYDDLLSTVGHGRRGHARRPLRLRRPRRGVLGREPRGARPPHRRLRPPGRRVAAPEPVLPATYGGPLFPFLPGR